MIIPPYQFPFHFITFPPSLCSHSENAASILNGEDDNNNNNEIVKRLDEEDADSFSLFQLFESIRPIKDSPEMEDPPGIIIFEIMYSSSFSFSFSIQLNLLSSFLGIQCKMRGFQRKALHWLVERETVKSIKGSEQLHPAWLGMEYSTSLSCYYLPKLISLSVL